MNQPNEQVTQQPPQYYPAAGYPQPQPQAVYQPYPVYQPVYQAPGFAIKRKDPRKTGAVRTLNKLALLMVAQTALSFVLQIGAVILCTGTGIDIYNDELALVLLSIGLSPICTAGPPLVYMLFGKKD